MITITRAEDMRTEDLIMVVTSYLDYDGNEVLGMRRTELEDDVQEYIDAFENSENYPDLLDKVERTENLFQGDDLEMNILEILTDLDEDDEFDMMYPNGKDDDDE